MPLPSIRVINADNCRIQLPSCPPNDTESGKLVRLSKLHDYFKQIDLKSTEDIYIKKIYDKPNDVNVPVDYRFDEIWLLDSL